MKSYFYRHLINNNAVEVTSPIFGTILRFCVFEGTVVTKGQTIAILESMKIEIEIKSNHSGKVHFVSSIGSTIKLGQTVAIIQVDNITNESFTGRLKTTCRKGKVIY